MCGIAGILGPIDGGKATLERMLSTLSYRGPDESGIFIGPDIQMGHARLSIIGLGDGTQPISNEDETIWIVFNGEIFNFPELRCELEEAGHIFSTHTDTEVLVHLYEEHGKDLLKLINGQFAFAIWDSRNNELMLARDRVGICPLFYHQAAGKFLFASEMKAILVDPSVPREIDCDALDQVFTCWSTVAPKTPFKDIHELPPGQFQVIKNGRIIAQQTYWEVPYSPCGERFSGTFEEAVLQLKHLLLDSIRIRLRADVPVGAYLSGGLDSSIITSLIAHNLNNELKTFSIGFQDGDFDETPYQHELVRQLGTDHSQLSISNKDIQENFPQVIWHCEKPLLRTAPVPMFMLAKLTRSKNIKVVLTGEGADEVFGGYDIFKEAKIRHFWSRFPQSDSRPRLLEKLHPYIFKNPARSSMMLRRFYAVTKQDINDPFFSHRIRWDNTAKNRMFFSDHVKSAIASSTMENYLHACLPDDFAARDTFSRAQQLEVTTFLSSYLLSSQGDRVAMGNSLELRVPFLDHRLIAFGMNLPDNWKIHGLNEKFILKKAFYDIIPTAITRRPKQPYRAPIRQVFFSPGNTYVDDMLSEQYLRKTGYFNPGKTSLLVNKFRSTDHYIASETQNMALVGILSTQLLHHSFIDNFSPSSVSPVAVKKTIIRSR